MAKSSGGFTLLEIIISIAAISFISVFILQMFITSSNLNNRAKDADIAVSKAITEIEKFKKHVDMSAYAETMGVRGITENGGKAEFYYDSDWNEMNVGSDKEARYSVRIAVTLDNNFSRSSGKLFSIQVNVIDVPGGKESRALATLETKKYFSDIS